MADSFTVPNMDKLYLTQAPDAETEYHARTPPSMAHTVARHIPTEEVAIANIFKIPGSSISALVRQLNSKSGGKEWKMCGSPAFFKSTPWFKAEKFPNVLPADQFKVPDVPESKIQPKPVILPSNFSER